MRYWGPEEANISSIEVINDVNIAEVKTTVILKIFEFRFIEVTDGLSKSSFSGVR